MKLTQALKCILNYYWYNRHILITDINTHYLSKAKLHVVFFLTLFKISALRMRYTGLKLTVYSIYLVHVTSSRIKTVRLYHWHFYLRRKLNFRTSIMKIQYKANRLPQRDARNMYLILYWPCIVINRIKRPTICTFYMCLF